MSAPRASSARILSIQVGLPREIAGTSAADPQSWRSGIFKHPVTGPVRVDVLNLAGDGQEDRAHHGGPDKAVLAYSADHYPAWNEELTRRGSSQRFLHGGFGENLTVAGVTEGEVCIGDTWRAGDACIQVSQPRQPCWKLVRRWQMPDLLLGRVIATGRSGWYLRVLQEGTISAGMPLQLESRPHPQWTIARVAALKYDSRLDPAAASALALLKELSASWRAGLSRHPKS